MSHVWGYDLTISYVDFWECPSFVFLCQPFAILLHLFYAQSTILKFHRTPPYPIHISNASSRRISFFVKSIFHFHTIQHSRKILSPYVFADEGWEISAWDRPFHRRRSDFKSGGPKNPARSAGNFFRCPPLLGCALHIEDTCPLDL